MNRIHSIGYLSENQKSHVVEENVFVLPYAVPNALHAVEDVGAKLGEDSKDVQSLFGQLEEHGEDFGKLFKNELPIEICRTYKSETLSYPINVNILCNF